MLTNITYWLDETADRLPNKIAFIDELADITFFEMRENARKVASYLIEKGYRKEPIIVMMNKGIDMLVTFIGIAYSGNFYVPIDGNMPEIRAKNIMNTSNSRCIITTEEIADIATILSPNAETKILSDIIRINSYNMTKIENIRKQTIDTDLLYVLFTSGSTGVPKGVAISHRSVIDYIEWVEKEFNIDENDIFGNQAPFYFDNSVLDIYIAIKTGACVNIIPKILFSQPLPLLTYIKENHINSLFWVPTVLILVARFNTFKKIDLSGVLKRVLFAGEVMPNKQLNYWRRNLPSTLFANLYGPTEITVDCTFFVVDRDFEDGEPLPIGIPIPNTGILVLNNQNEEVRVGEVGELCVRGSSLAFGYYNNPEKTRESFVQNPLNQSFSDIVYRTGDLVKYNEKGELLYISRKDFQIKHMGHRIELGEIESAVSKIDGISMSCCLYDDLNKKIVLFVDNKVDEAYIKSELKRYISDYMIPNKIKYIDEMPISPNGKIDRVRLKELL